MFTRKKNSAISTTSGENMNQSTGAEVYKTVAHYNFPFFKGKYSILKLCFMKKKRDVE